MQYGYLSLLPPLIAITLAIVKVLPEPVTPSSVCRASPSPRPDQACDRRSLVPRRAEIGDELERFLVIEKLVLGRIDRLAYHAFSFPGGNQ